jgi:hypothetical protein
MKIRIELVHLFWIFTLHLLIWKIQKIKKRIHILIEYFLVIDSPNLKITYNILLMNSCLSYLHELTLTFSSQFSLFKFYISDIILVFIVKIFYRFLHTKCLLFSSYSNPLAKKVRKLLKSFNISKLSQLLIINTILKLFKEICS